MLTKKEISYLLQIVQDNPGRGPCAARTGEQPGATDLRRLHLAVIMDSARHVTYATFVRFVQWMNSVDLRTYLSVFDQLSSQLEAAFRDATAIVVFDDFPKVTGVPKIVKRLLKEAIEGSVSKPELTLGMLRQILVFPLRFNMDGAEEVIEQLTEINATRHAMPSELLVQVAQALLTPEWEEAVATAFRPRHGNGSVGFLKNGRIVTKRCNPAIKDKLLNRDVIWPLFASNPYLEPLCRYYAHCACLGDAVPSTVISVPKTWKKKRIVAVEDVTRMYLQQGLRLGLYEGISRHSILSQHIDFSRPEKNRELARWGSKTRTFSTIDLSSASDCVSYQFVRELFKHLPHLWRMLDYLRTKEFYIREQGRIESNIFATMGNAICFPVMTIVFVLIVFEAAIQCKVPIEKLDFQVYGDDIVVPEVMTEKVLQLLQEYGFIPNTSKTFSGESYFRESCGGEYINGVDVSPIRISRKFTGLNLHSGIENLFAIVDLANAAWGLAPTVRTLCLDVLSSGYSFPIPFSIDGSVGAASVDPDEAMKGYEKGWYGHWQYRSYSVRWPRIHQRTYLRDQLISLGEWLAATDGRDGEALSTGDELPVITSSAKGSVGVSVANWDFLPDPGCLVRPKGRAKHQVRK